MGVQKVKTYKMINVSVQVHIVAGLCWFENKQDLEAERGHLCKIWKVKNKYQIKNKIRYHSYFTKQRWYLILLVLFFDSKCL